MCEAFGHVESSVVVRGELDRDVVEVGRAFGAQVDDDVEDRASRAPDELRLGRRRVLEVHAPHGAFTSIEGDVRLGDDRFEPVLLELVLAKRTGEEPAIVLFEIEVDDECALELGLREDHCVTPVIDGVSRSGRNPLLFRPLRCSTASRNNRGWTPRLPGRPRRRASLTSDAAPLSAPTARDAAPPSRRDRAHRLGGRLDGARRHDVAVHAGVDEVVGCPDLIGGDHGQSLCEPLVDDEAPGLVERGDDERIASV